MAKQTLTLRIGGNPNNPKDWEKCTVGANCKRHVHLDRFKDGTTFDDLGIIEDNETGEGWDNDENLTIGEITARLGKLGNLPQTAPVVVQFKGAFYPPSELISYRGDYSELAITPNMDADDDTVVTVNQFHKQLSKVVGKELVGWKGGEFKMTGWTRVWVDQMGEYNQQAVVNIKLIDGVVALLTKTIED